MCLACILGGKEHIDISRRQFLRAAATGLALAGLAATGIYAKPVKSQDKTDSEEKYKVEDVLINGSKEKRFDILFLPEGYTKSMQKQFDTDITEIMKAFDTFDLLKEYKPMFNFHKVWLESEKKWTEDADGTGTVFGVKCVKDANGNPNAGFPNGKEKKINKFAETELPCILINDLSPGVGGIDYLIVSPDHLTFCHEFGHAFRLGDEYAFTSDSYGFGINLSKDEKDTPWKELIGKVTGIKTQKIDEKCYIGEELCIMGAGYMNGPKQYGPICASHIASRLRGYCGVVETAPESKDVIEIGKTDKKNLEFKMLASKTYVPQLQAWYAKGTPEEMDKLKEELNKGEKQKPDAFSDKKKYTALKVNVDKKDKTKLVVDTSKLGEGSHVIFTRAYDQNPAIILDPNQESIERRVYRLEIKK